MDRHKYVWEGSLVTVLKKSFFAPHPQWTDSMHSQRPSCEPKDVTQATVCRVVFPKTGPTPRIHARPLTIHPPRAKITPSLATRHGATDAPNHCRYGREKS